MVLQSLKNQDLSVTIAIPSEFNKKTFQELYCDNEKIKNHGDMVVNHI